MKKLGLIVSFVLVGVFLMTNNAMAVLYYPDLFFDSYGVATYNSGSKTLTITGTPINIGFDSSGPKWIDMSQPPTTVDFYAEYVSGGYSSWYFQGDSGISPDIKILGKLVSPPVGFLNSGTLLLANITSLVFDGVDRVKGTFDILPGGDLYSYYAYTGYKGMFDITLEFTAGTPPSDPDHSFQSLGAKGNVSPIPEPTSLLLLGSGLLGFAMLARRKKIKL